MTTRYPSAAFRSTFFAALAGGMVAGAILLFAWHWLGRHPSATETALPYPAGPAPAHVPIHLTTYRSEAELPASVPDLRLAARRATPCVVRVNATAGLGRRERVKALFGSEEQNPPRDGGQGSGVIYRADGYVLTNDHVVRGAEEITVTLANRKRYPAGVVGRDAKSDLAVLRIEADDLPTLKFGDSDAAQPGEWVLAVGSPLGLSSTVTAGIISAKGRSIRLLRELDAIESFLQTDAAVNPGNSGGPLVSAEGKLLGINTAIATNSGRFEGYSFAIPVNLARRVADDIIRYGGYRRAYLGLEVSSLTARDVSRLRLRDRTEGVVVDKVFTDGSAAAAGLLPNDVVISAGGRPIRDVPQLTEVIGRAQVGETLNLGVVRDGKELEVVVKLIAFPE